MTNSPPPSPLLSIGLGQILPAVKITLDAIGHRGELAALELGEARAHAFTTVLCGLLAAGLGLLGAFAATFTLAALVWDRPDRALILGMASAVYLLGGALLVWLVAKRLRGWRPLQGFWQQLRDDRSCVQTIIGSTHESS